jgi:xanthine/CO dehydrogenase XdhC/CoxF family maturation factor
MENDMTEPKLFTEAEWVARFIGLLSSETCDALIAELRERGLIAEPVDVKRLAARRAVADFFGKPDEGVISEHCLEVELVMRGIEIGAERLTREMVDKGLEERGWYPAGSFVTALHASLVKQMKGE